MSMELTKEEWEYLRESATSSIRDLKIKIASLQRLIPIDNEQGEYLQEWQAHYENLLERRSIIYKQLNENNYIDIQGTEQFLDFLGFALGHEVLTDIIIEVSKDSIIDKQIGLMRFVKQ